MKTISKKDYLCALALLHLGKKKMEELKDIEKSLADVLEIKPDSSDYYGHVSDAIYNSYSVDELMFKLEIKRATPGRQIKK